MKHLPLHLGDDLAGVALVPVPVEVLGHGAELDDQVVREVLGLDLAALFPPQAEQGGFVVAHDDPGVRAADEAAPISGIGYLPSYCDHNFLHSRRHRAGISINNNC